MTFVREKKGFPYVYNNLVLKKGTGNADRSRCHHVSSHSCGHVRGSTTKDFHVDLRPSQGLVLMIDQSRVIGVGKSLYFTL